MRILIAVPTYESISAETFKSLWDLDKGKNEVLFESVRGYDVATARNKIAEKAISLGAGYVLMVDSDMVLPKNALQLLLEDDKDVCLGYCQRRISREDYDGLTSICKLHDRDGNEYYNYPPESCYTTEEMHDLAEAGETAIEVHGGGMACGLIRTSIFQTLTYPWFDWVNYGNANRGMLSEDLYFCSLCRASGIRIYADVRVGCGHLLKQVQWPE